MARLTYACAVLSKWMTLAVDFRCPYCSALARPVGQKWMLLVLFECPRCHLRFRVPKDDPESARSYYDTEYLEETVTDLPHESEWEERSPARFAKFLKDRTEFLIEITNRVRPRSVVDFGCSWGYVLDWFRGAGVEKCVGFEVSRPRAEIARQRLGLTVYSEREQLAAEQWGAHDLVYCAHVLEHLPQLRDVFAVFRDLLRPRGWLALATPNATDRPYRHGRLAQWGKYVGEAHTMAISYPFLRHALPREGFEIVKMGDPEAEELRVLAVRT